MWKRTVKINCFVFTVVFRLICAEKFPKVMLLCKFIIAAVFWTLAAGRQEQAAGSGPIRHAVMSTLCPKPAPLDGVAHGSACLTYLQ